MWYRLCWKRNRLHLVLSWLTLEIWSVGAHSTANTRNPMNILWMLAVLISAIKTKTKATMDKQEKKKKVDQRKQQNCNILWLLKQCYTKRDQKKDDEYLGQIISCEYRLKNFRPNEDNLKDWLFSDLEIQEIGCLFVWLVGWWRVGWLVFMAYQLYYVIKCHTEKYMK